MIRRLDWDSDFFKIEAGELIFGSEAANADDFDLVLVKSDEDFEFRLNGFNNDFSETKLIFAKEIGESTFESDTIFPFDSRKHDINVVYELAYESGKFSRFKLDKHFGEDKFREMYRKWVDNSINKKFADELLIMSDGNNNVKGFGSYKINGDTAQIGLIAVNPNFQRMGVGRQLLGCTEKILFLNGTKALHIATQESNVPACEFYVAQGYQIHTKTYIKHYWKTNDTI